MELTERDTARIRALIENSDLQSVEFHELSARRIAASNDEERKPQFEIGIQFRLDDEGFGVRLIGDLSLLTGDGRVSVSGEYRLTNGYTPAPRDVQLFANEVAVMTIFPYLREGVSDITNRVFGEGLILPILQRGQITLELDPDDLA